MPRSPFRPSPFMVFAFLTAIVFFEAGCAGEHYREVELRPGVTDFARVECSPEGNPYGYTLEFPRSACESGIAVSYVARKEPDGRIRGFYSLNRGYLTGVTPRVVVESADGVNIDKLYIEDSMGRLAEIEPNRETASEWSRNETRMREIVEAYRDDLYDVYLYCRFLR